MKMFKILSFYSYKMKRKQQSYIHKFLISRRFYVRPVLLTICCNYPHKSFDLMKELKLIIWKGKEQTKQLSTLIIMERVRPVKLKSSLKIKTSERLKSWSFDGIYIFYTLFCSTSFTFLQQQNSFPKMEQNEYEKKWFMIRISLVEQGNWDLNKGQIDYITVLLLYSKLSTQNDTNKPNDCN